MCAQCPDPNVLAAMDARVEAALREGYARPGSGEFVLLVCAEAGHLVFGPFPDRQRAVGYAREQAIECDWYAVPVATPWDCGADR